MQGATAKRLMVAVVSILSLFVIAACSKRSGSSASTDSSSTAAPVAETSPTAAPTTRPLAWLDIDGKAVEFPAAKLVITKRSGGIDAILCSDDPPSAIEANYMGNSFMIEMKLDVEDPSDLPTAVWEFKTEKREPQDSTTGIFLDGAKRQMQPADARVTFEKRGDRIVASVAGKFLLFDAHDVAAPVQLVDVKGKLDAAVREQ